MSLLAYRGESVKGSPADYCTPAYDWLGPPSDLWGEIFTTLAQHDGAERARGMVAELLADETHREQVKKAATRGALTLLHQTVLCGNAPVARMLLEAGADVDAANSEGHTPLHFAAAGTRDDEGDGGALSMTMMLLQKGADPTTHIHDKRGQGKTAHELAKQRGRPLVSDLLRAAKEAIENVEAHDEAEYIATTVAAAEDVLAKAGKLPAKVAAKAANVGELDPDKAHAAAARAASDADDEASAALAVNAEARAALLKRCTRSTPGVHDTVGAPSDLWGDVWEAMALEVSTATVPLRERGIVQVRANGAVPRSASQCATLRKDADARAAGLLDVLISQDPALAASGRTAKGQNTLLMRAAAMGCPKCAARLLLAGADPSTLNSAKHAPLHWAASAPAIGTGVLTVTRMLLHAGAPPDRLNIGGEGDTTPLRTALFRRNEEVIALFEVRERIHAREPPPTFASSAAHRRLPPSPAPLSSAPSASCRLMWAPRAAKRTTRPRARKPRAHGFAPRRPRRRAIRTRSRPPRLRASSTRSASSCT